MDQRPSWDDTWLDVARVVARRSLCSRAQVGAVIVNAQERVVATGYNGPPAQWGWNDVERIQPTNPMGRRSPVGTCESWCSRGRNGPTTDTAQSYTDCPSVHAEMNALMFANRTEVEGGTLYVTGEICWACAKPVANSGVVRVVIGIEDTDRSHRQGDQSVHMLMDSGIEVVRR
jgi:dCMP deaminase